jgi:hypothetical protein
MNSELSKTISTCVIWLAVACILTFGIFKMSISGYSLVFLIFFCLPLSTLYAAVKATQIIWHPPQAEKKAADSAAALTIKC